MKLGLQMYSIRDWVASAEDLESALKKLGAMGYETVQEVKVDRFDTEFWKRVMGEYGISVVCPCYTKKCMTQDTDSMIHHLREIGCDSFMLPWITTDDFVSVEGTMKNWEPYNDAIKKLEDAGITPAYHNHDFEFSPLLGYDGLYFDWLMENHPKWWYIFDVAWSSFAGADTLAWMEKLGPERLKYVHFKDYYNRFFAIQKPVFAPCGDGIVNLKPFLEKAKAMGVEHAIVEQDNATTRPDPFEEVARSAAYMKTIL